MDGVKFSEVTQLFYCAKHRWAALERQIPIPMHDIHINLLYKVLINKKKENEQKSGTYFISFSSRYLRF